MDTTRAFVTRQPRRPCDAAHARLLQRSRACSLSDIKTRLSHFSLPTWVQQARQHLRELQLNLDHVRERLNEAAQAGLLLDLYHQFFPEDWAQHIAESKPTLDTLSACEQHFLDQIDATLFPIAGCFDEDERPGGIYPIPQSVDLEHLNDTPEAYSPAHLLLMWLWDKDLSDAVYERLHAHYGDLPTMSWGNRVLHVERLREHCDPLGEPWSFLPDVYEVIAHQTNNLFLDPWLEDSLPHLEWDAGTLRWLTNEWNAAQHLLAKLDVVTEWLTASPELAQTVMALFEGCIVTLEEINHER